MRIRGIGGRGMCEYEGVCIREGYKTQSTTCSSGPVEGRQTSCREG